ncbi:MAG TPA: class I SAM-dependent methyltransferase [Caulobacteraceae bacterium]|nr:class I SAM-dependent methyltransferase [Caulobacteraceae bacterium]
MTGAEKGDGLVGDLAERIAQSNPTTVKMLDTAIAGLSAAERSELDAYLAYLRSAGHGLDFIAESYNTILRDTVREQIFFRRNGRYRHARYDEVAASVYMNDDYMSRYMVGLAVTTYLWPNHLAIHRFFRQTLPDAPAGDYLEIGPGHGVFFMAAARSGRFAKCLGVDLSPTSVAMTRSLLASGHFGDFQDYEIRQADFLDASLPPRAFQAVVMGEVLEHVERPDLFMARIRELAAPGAFVFVTTAINAPTIDHIFLFDSPEAVRDLVRQAGFEIVAEAVLPYVGMTLDETMAQRLPVNIALRLDPRV